jgi:hypothetical protein
LRKLFVALAVIGMVGGPFSAIANAGPYCTLLEKLGYNWVKECED